LEGTTTGFFLEEVWIRVKIVLKGEKMKGNFGRLRRFEEKRQRKSIEWN
jgi:hypothetical protein